MAAEAVEEEVCGIGGVSTSHGTASGLLSRKRRWKRTRLFPPRGILLILQERREERGKTNKIE
jgi:hypothetical protein